jgi:hypothetical protein
MSTMLARRVAGAVLGLGLIASVAPLAASADVPGPHPAYVHALHDLRYARFLIFREGPQNVEGPELAAAHEIDRAAFQIRQAAYDDGKDVNEYEPADVALDRHGRLRRTLELLYGAKRDITINGESDWAAAGWRNAAYRHLDSAIADTRRALRNLFADDE